MRTRKAVVLPQGQANADINVTPLVDVVLVLLIIFMVVTPLMQKDIELALPVTSDEPEPEKPEHPQLLLRISLEGRLTLNAEPIEEADYIPRLRRVFAARPTGQRLLFFSADERAPYGKVVAALDGAKAAGAEMLGMAPALP